MKVRLYLACSTADTDLVDRSLGAAGHCASTGIARNGISATRAARCRTMDGDRQRRKSLPPTVCSTSRLARLESSRIRFRRCLRLAYESSLDYHE